jgi:hypothetical protein
VRAELGKEYVYFAGSGEEVKIGLAVAQIEQLRDKVL